MPSLKQLDDERCHKISVFRRAARGVSMVDLLNSPCPTCGRARAEAYLRVDQDGNVLEGCVDAHHSGATKPGAPTRWYMRPEARQLRAETHRALAEVHYRG
jgi:hypothetical protein